ncbi:hypothetical protein ACSBR1_012206 [Camellia fascicularis]
MVQLSVTISTSSSFPSFSPFQQPTQNPPPPLPPTIERPKKPKHHALRVNHHHHHVGPLHALKGTGFLSAIGQAIEEEQYRKARAEVNRKGFNLEGYSIEGVSIGGHETCVIVPELKSAFDIGRCPSRAVNQNFVFITHAHLDHIGYVIYSVRKKLRKQYMHLNGKQIEKLKKSGVEITDTILSPEVAFTGDTMSDFYLDPRSADALRAKILITEATFLDEGCSIEHAREHGHTHLFEIIEHAQWIRNKAVLLTHFSPRYNIEDIRLAVSKLQLKVSAKVVALTEGFKSTYS